MANLWPWMALAGLGAFLSGTVPRQAWTAALAVTGVLLMALR